MGTVSLDSLTKEEIADEVVKRDKIIADRDEEIERLKKELVNSNRGAQRNFEALELCVKKNKVLEEELAAHDAEIEQLKEELEQAIEYTKVVERSLSMSYESASTRAEQSEREIERLKESSNKGLIAYLALENALAAMTKERDELDSTLSECIRRAIEVRKELHYSQDQLANERKAVEWASENMWMEPEDKEKYANYSLTADEIRKKASGK